MSSLEKLVQQWVANPSFLVRRGLSGAKGKVGLLVFGARPTPELYIKMARFKGENESIAEEGAALTQVNEMLSGGPLEGTVPKICFSDSLEGRRVLGLSGMGGFSMLSEILGQRNARRRQSLQFLEMGYSWLSEFRKTGWAHGDFCPKNLLVAGERLNVVDWEYAFPEAGPTFDLFYFSLKFGFWLFGQDREDGRRHAFFKTFLERNWLSARVKEELSPLRDLRESFLEPLEFQARKEERRTGVAENFWVELLEYAREFVGEI